VSAVPPTPSTSGSEAGRLTSLTGVPHRGSLDAPESPELASTVTWSAAAPSRMECIWATWAVVK